MTDKHEITLDSLMDQSLQVQAQVNPEEITQELTKQVETLTPQEREKVDAIKHAINVQDSQSLAVYGANSQKNIAAFSEAILSEVRNKDSGDVGELMGELMVKVKDMDFSAVDNGGLFSKLPFVKSAKRSVDNYLARYDSVAHSIDKIQAQLENSRMELLKDIGTFDKLYEKNVDYFNELQLYIVAGEEKVEELQNEVIPRLLEEAKQADDPMAIQVVNDFQDSVGRFEKRIFDLKTSKTLAIQTAPQIKLIQNNDKLLVDKVTDAIHNTIPLWKSQVVIALGLNKQGQVLEMQQEVSDTTNELLRRNSEKLKQTTLEVAKEAERSTIDVETLQKVNEDLIATIEESIEIHQNARQARQQAEAEIQKIESNLQTAMVKAIESNQ